MKIVIATDGNPKLIKTWSGIPYFIVKRLEKNGHEVYGVDLKLPTITFFERVLKSFYWRTQKRWFFTMFEKKNLMITSRQLDNAVNKINPDIVLVVKTDYLAYTTFKQPAITIHDATFALLIDYYDTFMNVTKKTLNSGNKMYQNALEKASASIFSSDWASKSAIHDYHISPNKVYTIPLGANMEDVPEMASITKCVANRTENSVCDFLFLGVDWVRKGGDDALKFVWELNQIGVKTRLTVIGCNPEIPEMYADYIHIVGFLNKNNPDDKQILLKSIIETNAIILPSIAECYGCVFCEANAFGLPALGRDTGGISEIIKDGVNGLLLGINETPAEFAHRWKLIWENKNNYIEMSHRARKEYDERLNYDVFVSQLEEIMNRLVSATTLNK